MTKRRPSILEDWPGARTAAGVLGLATVDDVLSVVELLASEYPELVPTVVATLASSPARPVLLELLPLFQVKEPAELAAVAITTASQLDRLERRVRWTVPRDVLGAAALPAQALAAFAKCRAGRWRNRPAVRPEPSRLARVRRLLKEAAGLERARALVEECLN